MLQCKASFNFKWRQRQLEERGERGYCVFSFEHCNKGVGREISQLSPHYREFKLFKVEAGGGGVVLNR